MEITDNTPLPLFPSQSKETGSTEQEEQQSTEVGAELSEVDLGLKNQPDFEELISFTHSFNNYQICRCIHTQEELNKTNWLKKKIYIEKELREINNLKSIITKNTSKVSNLIKEKQDNITKLTLKENLKKQYQDSHATNEETSLYFKLESNLNTLKTELSTQEILYNNYKNSLHQVTKNLSIFSWTNELKTLDLRSTTTLKAILTNINENNLGIGDNNYIKIM